MLDGIIGASIGGLCTIIGILVSHLLTQRAENKKLRKEILADSYANFFSCYTSYLAYRSRENQGKVIAAIEKTRLFCSVESQDILKKLENVLLDQRNPISDCAPFVNQLHSAARKDLEQ